MNKTLLPWQKTPPFPARGQSVKYPNLERNVLIAIAALIFSLTALAVYKVESSEQDRARIQNAQEEKAIYGKHAVEVSP